VRGVAGVNPVDPAVKEVTPVVTGMVYLNSYLLQ